MAFKIDIHNHILPERWPDLKEVRAKKDELLTPMLLHACLVYVCPNKKIILNGQWPYLY